MSAHFAKLSVGCYAQNNCKKVSPERLKMSQNPYLNLICAQHRFRYGFCNFSTPAPEGVDFGGWNCSKHGTPYGPIVPRVGGEVPEEVRKMLEG